MLTEEIELAPREPVVHVLEDRSLVGESHMAAGTVRNHDVDRDRGGVGLGKFRTCKPEVSFPHSLPPNFILSTMDCTDVTSFESLIPLVDKMNSLLPVR